MTVADLYVFCELELSKAFMEDLLVPYPKLSALFARVAADEKVAEWIAKRPKTRFWREKYKYGKKQRRWRNQQWNKVSTT